jgi:hypothetical protein
MEIGVILVIILCLWSITKTLEKLVDKILDKQDIHYKLLEDIKGELERNNTKSK